MQVNGGEKVNPQDQDRTLALPIITKDGTPCHHQAMENPMDVVMQCLSCLLMGEERVHHLCRPMEEVMARPQCNIMVFLMVEENHTMEEENNTMEEENNSMEEVNPIMEEVSQITEEVNQTMEEENHTKEEEMLIELGLEESCQTQLHHQKQELGTHLILDLIAGTDLSEEVLTKKQGVDLILELGKIQVETQVPILNRNHPAGRSKNLKHGVMRQTPGQAMITINSGQTMTDLVK